MNYAYTSTGRDYTFRILLDGHYFALVARAISKPTPVSTRLWLCDRNDLNIPICGVTLTDVQCTNRQFVKAVFTAQLNNLFGARLQIL